MVILAAGSWFTWSRRAGTGAAGLDAGLLAILPFRVTADASLDYLGEGMLDLLAASLPTTGDLRAADARTVLSAWRRAAGSERSDLPADSALRLGIVERHRLLAFLGPRYPQPSTGAERIDAIRHAAEAAPDNADLWFQYADLLVHDGPAAGISDAGTLAIDAFDRAPLGRAVAPAQRRQQPGRLTPPLWLSTRVLFNLPTRGRPPRRAERRPRRCDPGVPALPHSAHGP